MAACVRIFYLFGLLFTVPLLSAQEMDRRVAAPPVAAAPNAALWQGMNYRNIGPFRGGRSAAVTGVPGKPTTFYFGGTGGGVWRTVDGGSNWKNISDGAFGGSIGAIAVSEWDPNVIYVGGGEKTVRGNVSSGYGMHRSLDGGKSWKQVGLSDTRHIPRIRIHPKNPNLVYAAALGHLYGANQERGIFRSKDGGDTWEKVLFVSDVAGAVDLCMDPGNPRIIFASFWRVKRTPSSLESGGEGSGLWKSIDGGDTWTEITAKKGLPKGPHGIIGVTVSPVDPERIWAIVEAEDGGVFRSEDGGETWKRINDERSLRQRAWYYTRIYADTQNRDTVYVLNVRMWKSVDGGATFKSIAVPHGDTHDLWIDPQEPQRMVLGNDGGAQVSFDGGEHWSSLNNQPTAQFYRVTTDNDFPYRIYAAQQDNSTVRIRHRTDGRWISAQDWESTAGGESGHLAPHPENPDIVYGGSYGGYLARYNHRTGANRNVNIWPDNPMGHGAADLKYRFQWNFPIFFSPHDSGVLYSAANVLFKSTDEGHSWTAISGDLTTDDKSKQGSSGGPITKDNTSVEYYCTIFAAAESALEKDLLWTGSDDGLVHVSRDGGANWENVTPPSLPAWTQINSIEVHPTQKGGLYLAGTRYKLDDFAPYLYKTLDYGKTWTKITSGIHESHFTRVIRADPEQAGLLFTGTESGMYASFDDGTSWQPFQLNLPVVPITDMVFKDKDLIVATQGRALWVLDDVTPLHHLQQQTPTDKALLFPPRDSWRLSSRASKEPGNNGANLPGGVMVHFYLPEDPTQEPAKEKDEDATEQVSAVSKPDEVPKKQLVLSFLNKAGDTIREFATGISEDEEKKGPRGKLEAKKGFNRFTWNMSYPDATSFDKMIVWSGRMTGPRVPPGEYQVRLSYGDVSETQAFTLVADPRSRATQEDLANQFHFLMEITEKLTETHRALESIGKVRAQVDQLTKPLKNKDDYMGILDAAKALKQKLEKVETTLYQTKNSSRQDPLNFPIRLNDKLAGVKGTAETGDYPPTAAAIAVKRELTAAIDVQLQELKRILAEDLVAFNKTVADAAVPAIMLE